MSEFNKFSNCICIWKSIGKCKINTFLRCEFFYAHARPTINSWNCCLRFSTVDSHSTTSFEVINDWTASGPVTPFCWFPRSFRTILPTIGAGQINLSSNHHPQAFLVGVFASFHALIKSPTPFLKSAYFKWFKLNGLST